jgi:hypothetical protein
MCENPSATTSICLLPTNTVHDEFIGKFSILTSIVLFRAAYRSRLCARLSNHSDRMFVCVCVCVYISLFVQHGHVFSDNCPNESNSCLQHWYVSQHRRPIGFRHRSMLNIVSLSIIAKHRSHYECIQYRCCHH